MPRDLANEPALPVDLIQGDILAGLLKRHEHLMFFSIADNGKFKKFLKTVHITSLRECLEQRERVSRNKDENVTVELPTPGLNIAFTFSGLQALGVGTLPSTGELKPFIDGMQGSRAALNDPPASQWKILRPDARLHGVFIVTGSTHAEVVDVVSLRLATAAENGWQLLHEEVGQVRPFPVKDHEHFGFADGVSQPGIRGTVDGKALTPQADGAEDSQGQKGQDLLWPGEFVFGYPGQDPEADSFETKGEVVTPPIPFMENGAFLVFRRLAQDVPEFHHAVKAAALSVPSSGNPMDPDLLGAQMVGRWKSGAPIIKAPIHDDLDLANGTPDVNDFEFNGDRKGLICPWAAHIRKAYPRDDVPGTTTPSQTDGTIGRAEAFTQTHRMLRRGIAFGPELTEEEALAHRSAGGSRSRGLLFKCYVTSIVDQFEFVQQRWCNAGDFSQPGAGIDPIIGQAPTPSRPFLGAAPVTMDPADKPKLSFQSFVHLEGGAYFFAPAIDAVQGL